MRYRNKLERFPLSITSTLDLYFQASMEGAYQKGAPCGTQL
jgi:hypothetical protein